MNKKWLIICVALLIIGIAAGLVFGTLKGDNDNRFVELDTSYITVEFPAQYTDVMKHVETVEDGATVEIFYMILDDKEIELFRIYFGAAHKGTVEGYLHLESGVLPISVVIEDSDQTAAMNEEMAAQYYSMMDALNIVLDSIAKNDQFSKSVISTVTQTQHQLTYWSFDLPADIVCEESTEGSQYRIDFSYYFAGEKILLYTVYLGGYPQGSTIGFFETDGETKPIFLEINESVQQDMLPDDAKDRIYALMDTINHVLETIMSSKQFSTESE